MVHRSLLVREASLCMSLSCLECIPQKGEGAVRHRIKAKLGDSMYVQYICKYDEYN